MNKEKSNPLQKLRFLLLTPAIAVLALISTTASAEVALEEECLSQSMATAPQDTIAKKGSVSISGMPQDGVVYLVDGERMDAAKIKSINPESILKIDVLKGEKAQMLVTEDNLEGVIAISTKAGQHTAEAKEMQRKIEHINAANVPGATSKTETTAQLPANALYILDGKEISREKVQAVNPNSIATIEVLKDETAVRQYGEKGRNGVIKITTKK